MVSAYQFAKIGLLQQVRRVQESRAQMQAVQRKPLAIARAVNSGRVPELLEVRGYASAEGDAEYNLVLSQERANAVGDLLASIPALAAVQMSAPAGYGEANPVGDNETEEGRKTNRRVEMLFYFQGCQGPVGTEGERSVELNACGHGNRAVGVVMRGVSLLCRWWLGWV